MKYIIPYITKKKNPKAGRTTFQMPGAITKEYDKLGNVISMEQEMVTYHTAIPDPDYFYEYDKTTQIGCDNCNAIFSISDLIYNLDEDSQGSWHGSNSTCPKCNQSYCCELEYQK